MLRRWELQGRMVDTSRRGLGAPGNGRTADHIRPPNCLDCLNGSDETSGQQQISGNKADDRRYDDENGNTGQPPTAATPHDAGRMNPQNSKKYAHGSTCCAHCTLVRWSVHHKCLLKLSKVNWSAPMRLRYSELEMNSTLLNALSMFFSRANGNSSWMLALASFNTSAGVI